MIIECISDLHGYYPKLEGGDLLIVAGDLTARDEPWEYQKFAQWIMSQQYIEKIVIAGNHDNYLEGMERDEPICKHFTYLCDSGTEFEWEEEGYAINEDGLDDARTTKRKLKIWGSPWVKSFPGMNPHCKAFTVDTEEELAAKWALIPDDIDILVTRSPLWGMHDEVKRYDTGLFEHVGSDSLLSRWINIDAKVHIFGHIHEGYGIYHHKDCVYINASHVDDHYQPVNKPIRIEL